MAGTTPRLPEQFRSEPTDDNFSVSELVSEAAGAHSPYGDIVIPMPPESTFYRHPGPAERPHLADGR
jgi:hypothetical protein